jgi:hydroxymethylpyrimidine/phosphomethylpyrimidine kinase
MSMNNAHFSHEFPRVLSIAGSDSGGGAGIQADLKTFAALGCFGMTAITALTAQNTQGVRAIHGVPPAMLLDQIDAVVEDIGVHATKIGMLHSVEIVQAVTQAIERHQLKHIVLDPVMVATSGAVLISQDAVAELVTRLFSQADLITPNLDEAALLVGRTLHNESDIEAAAQQLLDKGAQAVLIKGGHLLGETVSDLFMSSSGESFWMRAPRIASPNTHGTGCTLSSAIAAHLALGQALPAAIRAGHAYVRNALTAAAHVRTGTGSGPLNHGAAPRPMQLISL